MSNHHTPNHGEYIPETYVPHAESHGTKSLWRTFWILLLITVVDFIIYFAFGHSLGRNLVFVAFGIVKAILIVGIFMHLNYEAKFLRYMIVLPAIVFLSYLVWFLLVEGNYVSIVKYVL
ncbi:MAG TPA: cytochrome C oxidase subunit IV family protein [Bacteroidia bacterium]